MKFCVSNNLTFVNTFCLPALHLNITQLAIIKRKTAKTIKTLKGGGMKWKLLKREGISGTRSRFRT